jgi:hypothetical protein
MYKYSLSRRLRLRWLCGAFALGIALPLPAHDGETHGTGAVLPDQAIEPRVEMSGEAVEVLGILKGKDLWLFVSRWATNAPLAGLRVSAESGGSEMPATAVADGLYRSTAEVLARPGRHAIIVSVQGDGVEDLLTGELTVNATANTGGLLRWFGWAALAAICVAVITITIARRRRHV